MFSTLIVPLVTVFFYFYCFITPCLKHMILATLVGAGACALQVVVLFSVSPPFPLLPSTSCSLSIFKDLSSCPRVFVSHLLFIYALRFSYKRGQAIF